MCKEEGRGGERGIGTGHTLNLYMEEGIQSKNGTERQLWVDGGEGTSITEFHGSRPRGEVIKCKLLPTFQKIF